MRRRWVVRLRSQVLVVLLLAPLSISSGGEEQVKLNSGLVLKGKAQTVQVITDDPKLWGTFGQTGRRKVAAGRFLLVTNPVKRYFVSKKAIRSREPADGLKGSETFRLRHRMLGKLQAPRWIGGFFAEAPFDKLGERNIVLATNVGKKNIIQGMELITPEYIQIKSLTHQWKYAVATSSVDSTTLDRILENSIDPNDGLAHMSLAMFYIEANRYIEAGKWLQKTRETFPQHKARCEAAELSLRLAYAEELLREIEYRQQGEQHDLVRALLAKFPRQNLPPGILARVKDIETLYSESADAIARVHGLLGDFEAELEPALAKQVRPLRGDVADNLTISNVERFAPFLNLANDDTLSPDRKLSYAYSGWLLGATNAQSNLPETIGLWNARLLAMAYLDSDDPFARRGFADEVRRQEGVSPGKLVQLLREMPPDHPMGVNDQTIIPRTGTSENGQPFAYKITLPRDYSPYHSYPMIVTLRREDRTTEQQLRWWAGSANAEGQSSRRGYIVIAPEYIEPGTREWKYEAGPHRIVIDSIRDAFRRFAVDPDRVFLSGHGIGGNATFDIAMSHPDLFAGAIPITGVAGRIANTYARNAKTVPWYVVLGERHHDSLPANVDALKYLHSAKNTDLLVCQYLGRGFEHYYEEIHNLFDWMDGHRRGPIPTEFSVHTMRREDRQFFWYEASQLPEGVLPEEPDFANARAPRMKIEATIRKTKTSLIIRSGPKKNVVLRIIEGPFDPAKKLMVSGRRRPFIIEPAVKDVLEDFRIYRDRSRIALQRLAIVK